MTIDVEKFLRDPELVEALRIKAERNERTLEGELRQIVARDLRMEIISLQAEKERQAKEEEKRRIREAREERQLAQQRLQEDKESRRQARLRLHEQKLEEAAVYRGRVEFHHGMFFAVDIDPMTGIRRRVGKGKPTADEAALEWDDAHRDEVTAGKFQQAALNFPHVTLPAAERRYAYFHGNFMSSPGADVAPQMPQPLTGQPKAVVNLAPAGFKPRVFRNGKWFEVESGIEVEKDGTPKIALVPAKKVAKKGKR